MSTRRKFIGLLMIALAAAPGTAWSDDSGGHDSGGHDAGGHDNGGDNGRDNGAGAGDQGRNGKPASGPSKSDNLKHRDQGTARSAVMHGEAVSLREVLDAVDHSIGGDVVDVRLVNDQSGLRYDLKIIDRQGRLVEVSVNALTKEISKVKGF